MYDEISRHERRKAFAATINRLQTCVKCKAIDNTVHGSFDTCLSCETSEHREEDKE